MTGAAERGARPAPHGRPRYRPIRDYALIGDCHGGALVCRDGAIDWGCIGRFDAEPVFSRLLDATRGGFFAIAPVAPARADRRYLGDTAILVTRFITKSGEARLIDFMPLGRRPDAAVHDYTRPNAPGWIVRAVHGVSGRVQLRAVYRPTPGLLPAGDAGRDRSVPVLQATVPLVEGHDRLEATFDLSEGDAACFVMSPATLRARDLRALADRMLGITRCFWEEWIGYCRGGADHAPALRRSAVVLKLLTYAPTGAIVAAPTTSLPEWIGGARNWDYRYAWIRDSSFALYALAGLGYIGEARAFVDFLRRQHLRRDGLRLMYGIGGELDLSEREIEPFEGYGASRPVRVGNAAHTQLQTDIYGELLEFAHLYEALGGRFDRSERAELAYVADLAAMNWRKPDHGIWEVRTRPRHFVHSKIMCWMALDRAAKLLGDRPRWRRARREIVAAVRREGIDPEGGHLVQAFGRRGTDVALLAAAWGDFPVARGVLSRTVAAIVEELGEGACLRRYRTGDGLGGEEGCFLMGSFWLVSALLFLDRADEAERLLAALLERANDVGLYAEELDPRDGAFLGNFPQAFVHVALVTAALRLRLYREGGAALLRWPHPGRARLRLGKMSGVGRLWTFMRRALRVGRTGGSTRSILPLS